MRNTHCAHFYLPKHKFPIFSARSSNHCELWSVNILLIIIHDAWWLCNWQVVLLLSYIFFCDRAQTNFLSPLVQIHFPAPFFTVCLPASFGARKRCLTPALTYLSIWLYVTLSLFINLEFFERGNNPFEILISFDRKFWDQFQLRAEMSPLCEEENPLRKDGNRNLIRQKPQEGSRAPRSYFWKRFPLRMSL